MKVVWLCDTICLCIVCGQQGQNTGQRKALGKKVDDMELKDFMDLRLLQEIQDQQNQYFEEKRKKE